MAVMWTTKVRIWLCYDTLNGLTGDAQLYSEVSPRDKINENQRNQSHQAQDRLVVRIACHGRTQHYKYGPQLDEYPRGGKEYIAKQQDASTGGFFQPTNYERQKVVRPACPQRNSKPIRPYPPGEQQNFLIGLEKGLV